MNRELFPYDAQTYRREILIVELEASEEQRVSPRDPSTEGSHGPVESVPSLFRASLYS